MRKSKGGKSSKYGAVRLWYRYQQRGFKLWREQRYEESLAAFEQSLFHNPMIVETWALKSQALTMVQRHDEALQAIEEARRLDEASVQPRWALNIATLKIDVLIALNRLADAQSLAEEMTHRFPDKLASWSMLGFTYTRSQRYLDAIAAYNQAIKLPPDVRKDLLDCWQGLAFCHLQLKRYDEAFEATDHALALDRQIAQNWIYRGYALSGLKRYAESADAFHQATVLQPDLEEAQSGEIQATLFAGNIANWWTLMMKRIQESDEQSE